MGRININFVIALLLVTAGYGLLDAAGRQVGLGSSLGCLGVGIYALVHGSIIAVQKPRQDA